MPEPFATNSTSFSKVDRITTVLQEALRVSCKATIRNAILYGAIALYMKVSPWFVSIEKEVSVEVSGFPGNPRLKQRNSQTTQIGFRV